MNILNIKKICNYFIRYIFVFLLLSVYILEPMSAKAMEIEEAETLQDLKKQGYWIYAAEANQGQSYQNLKFDGAKVLVVGSEGYGISPLVIKQADFRIFIPMKGKVNSLNVSVATAILIAKMIQN